LPYVSRAGERWEVLVRSRRQRSPEIPTRIAVSSTRRYGVAQDLTDVLMRAMCCIERAASLYSLENL
jgi:hypothetical protein